MRLLTVCLLVTGWVTGTARADVKPHPLFTDNMVLQQGAEASVWGKADPGEKVTVEFARLIAAAAPVTAEATADADGKWAVKLPKQTAGTGFTLTIKGKNAVEFKNVAVGEVWIASGQSNMEWPVDRGWDAEKFKAAAKNPNLRLFTVEKRTATAPISDQDDLKHFTRWDEAAPETIGGFSAVAYHFGSHLQKTLNVPVGMIHTSWGGTPAEAWTSTEALAATPELKYYVRNAATLAKGKQPVGPHTPASLYNAMIHPLLPFAIKGALWYQGESNAGRAAEYRTLFPTMIEDWRKRWGHDFPFVCVQLAPYNNQDADAVQYAELRDAQLLATKTLKNVGMAVITDVGDLFDIHPKDKLTVGTRLGLSARGIAYGQKLIHTGPTYKEMKVEDGAAVLSFDHLGGGLAARSSPVGFSQSGVVYGFAICGEDREFVPAKGVIKGDTVVVSSPEVPKPVAVRFGWKNYPVVNLYNKSADGKTVALPASPFRTDDFPLTTESKKK